MPFIAFGIYILSFLLLISRLKGMISGRIFAGILLTSIGWSFSSWMMHVGYAPSPYFWLLAILAFSIPLSPLMLHFAVEYPRRKLRIMWLVLLWYGIALSLEVTNLLGKFVERVTPVPDIRGVVHIEFSPLMMYLGFPYMALTILVMAAVFLNHYYSTNSRDERLLLRYPLIGTLFLFGGGMLNIFPALAGYPFDLLCNIAFAITLAFAIFKHQFLNIRIVLRKNMAYIIMTLVMSFIFIFVLIQIKKLTSEINSFYLWLMMLPLAATFGFILFHMTRKLQSAIDRLFFGKRYDYRETLLTFSQHMGDSLDLVKLAKTLVEMICGSLGCNKAALFLPAIEGDSLELHSSIGYENLHLASNLRISNDDPFLIWAKKRGRPLLKIDIEIMSQPGNTLLVDLSWMEQLSGSLVCPLILRASLVGLIVLGPKRLGEQYDDEDLLLISTISHQVAVSLDNAYLYTESQQTLTQLKQAQENLVHTERMRAFGQMASGIAHDFNNVLTTILGRVQLALRGVQDAKLRRNMEIIEQSALDAAQMVRRLQDATRVRTDQYFELVDMNQIMESALENIKPRLDELLETKDARIRTVFDRAQISPVEGSAGELREVMANILLNAVEAMPGGGELTLKSQQQNNRVAVTVSDTGIGMSAEVKKKLFTPFFTTKGSKGLGMGLSVSYGIINRHGGSIEVSSEPGKGSTFIIKFPVAKRGQEKVISKAPEIDAGNATILVIDDDEGARKVISETLSEAGHKVDIAVNGQEGLSLARRKVYDLVVADLGMPDISGRQVARAIKSDNPMIPVLLITGWGVQLDPLELEKDGVDGLIAKPFKSEEILTEVAKLLPPETESRDV